MIHAMTVDVEDYYCLAARDLFGKHVPASPAAARCTIRLLDLLDESGVKGTFFVLGEMAEASPDLIRDIARRGHELGVHGFHHRQIFRLSARQFRREVSDARKCIEDLAQVPILGHRAPRFSFRRDTLWAFEVLLEEGFRYDSSLNPAAAARFGWSGFEPDIHELALPGGRKIVEAPMSVVRIPGGVLPACGGGWLRHFPYWYTRWAWRRISSARPVIVYTHPYEIDTEPPPEWFVRGLAAAGRKARRFDKRQSRNRHTVADKLSRLLASYRFAPLRDVIERALGRPL